ncbi:hypothetical protein Tco_0650186, partial [Tanacetum coccineum]
DNASSAVTYTSISSDSNGLSWGIPLVNVGELSEMDPYEEVAQQGQAPPLSPAYVPDPMELEEHVPVYVPEPDHPEYHVPTDDDIQVEDQPYADDASPTAESLGHIADSQSMEEYSIDYPYKPEDNDEDLEEDPEEDHTDDPANGEDGDDEPSDDDDDDDDTDDEDKEPTKDEEEEEHIAPADPSAIPVVDPVPSVGDTEAFETDESAPTPRSPQTRVPFSQTRLRRARKTVRLDPSMSASMETRIAEHAAAPIPPTSLAYDQAPLGHRAAMIRMRDDIPEEDMLPQRRFVLAAPLPGCDVVESSAARPPRAADRAEDVCYVRALQASEHRMMTSIEEINLRTDRRDIRLEIDVVRGQRTAYETELHKVRHSYLSFEAQNRALLARLETLETHMSRMEWQCQSAEDRAVKQMMRTQVLEARARIDTVEDAGSSCHDAAYAMTWGTLKKKLTYKYCPKGEIKKLEIELWNLRVDKYISGLPDNIHRNVMSARPKTLDDAIELANDLMDQKLRTYAERQNDNKRKADDSSRNNQQPHKKQNVARAYTADPSEKKDYTGNLPLCTKCNYHHTGQCAPKCGNCKRHGHATNDCRVNTNNKKKKKNQKSRACYECGRAYALGGRDVIQDSNVITGMFLLNNRYVTILFDTSADRSFVSTTFSALINITPTTLENHYDVELANGKIIGVNTIIRDCTLISA